MEDCKNKFELGRVSIDVLTHDIQTFHGMFKHNHLKAEYSEELLHRAIDIEPMFNGKLSWKSGSHNPGADILIYTDETKTVLDKSISVKSGSFKISRSVIKISGSRLTMCNSDMNCVTEKLKQYTSDTIISLIYSNDPISCYTVFYIDRGVFKYPKTGSGWSTRIGERNGLVNEYIYRDKSGFKVGVKPSLAWQAWWDIPVNLCRVGPIIKTDG